MYKLAKLYTSTDLELVLVMHDICALQWSQVLLNTSTLGNVSQLMTQLDAVCLSKSSCTLGAAKAFVAINLQLERIKVGLVHTYLRWHFCTHSGCLVALLFVCRLVTKRLPRILLCVMHML